MKHVKSCHTDLYIQFDKTTAGLIEPLDVSSLAEDKLCTLIGVGKFNENTQKIIQILRMKEKY